MSLLLSLFANNLLPVFFMAGTGFALGHWMQVDAKAISRVVFYVFSPCLIFNLLTTSQLNGADILRMMGFGMVHMLSMAGIAWILSRFLRLERTLMVAVILTAMLPNAGNYGLSVVQFAFGDVALAFASLYFVMSAILANTVGVFVVSLGNYSLREALRGLLRIPGLYAAILAILVNWLDWTVPLPLARSVSVLAGAAIPGMLVMLGLQLQKATWTGQSVALGTAVSLRMFVSVGLGILLSGLFKLETPAYQAGVMEAGMPAAVMTTVLATEYDCKPSFVTLVVFVTTIISPLTLTPLLAYLGASW